HDCRQDRFIRAPPSLAGRGHRGVVRRGGHLPAGQVPAPREVMETPEEQPQEPAAAAPAAEPSHPARELSLHLLRMLETRVDAAGIALEAESQRLLSRLQLRILAAAAGFIGIWCGIVLLAVALPENLRVPVLGAVVGLFIVGAVTAWVLASRMVANRAVG